jgi:hypothetical protein
VNRRAVVIVGLAAVATIVITAATSGGSSTRLPLPITVANGAPTHRAPGGTAHGGIDSGGSSAGQGQTYTTAPLAPLTGCTVSVSNPTPLRGQTAETVTVQTAAGAHVALDASYYSHHSTHGGLASSAGGVTFFLTINHAPVNVTVGVKATASLRGVQKTCLTSFTPIL